MNWIWTSKNQYLQVTQSKLRILKLDVGPVRAPHFENYLYYKKIAYMLLNYWFKAWFWPFLPYVKTAYLGSKQQLSGRGWCKYWPWASRGAELRPTPWPDAHRTMVATALTHQWNTGNRGRRPGMSFSLHSSSWVLEPGYGRDIQVSPPPPPPHMMDVDTFLNRPITFIIWGQSSQYIFITVLLKMCAMLLKTLSMNSPFRKKN